MGRTVPTWRTRIEDELQNLDGYRRALPSSEKLLLDELRNGVRRRRTADGMLPAHEVWKPMLLSMVMELMARNAKLEHRLQLLESQREADHDRFDP